MTRLLPERFDAVAAEGFRNAHELVAFGLLLIDRNRAGLLVYRTNYEQSVKRFCKSEVCEPCDAPELAPEYDYAWSVWAIYRGLPDPTPTPDKR